MHRIHRCPQQFTEKKKKQKEKRNGRRRISSSLRTTTATLNQVHGGRTDGEPLNWWSLFVRLANPKERLEAITSRPLLLSGIARKTSHAGQQYVTVTAMHGYGQEAKAMLTRISVMLKAWKATAEQLGLKTVWQQVCEYIVTTVTGFSWAAPPLLAAPPPQGVAV